LDKAHFIPALREFEILPDPLRVGAPADPAELRTRTTGPYVHAHASPVHVIRAPPTGLEIPTGQTVAHGV